MKRTLLFLFLLVAGVSSAQIVNIPDANFKQLLLTGGANIVLKNVEGTIIENADTNNDGEIQESEALQIGTIIISSGATLQNLTGITAFSNLEILELNGVSTLQQLDVSEMLSLQNLKLENTGAVSLNFSGCINLKTFICTNNNSLIGGFDFSNLNLLTNIDCSNSSITFVAFANNEALRFLYLDGTSISSIDLSGLAMLELLSVSDTGLTELELGYLPNFSGLNCRNTAITSLNFSGCSLFTSLSANGTALSYVNLKNGNTNMDLLLINNLLNCFYTNPGIPVPINICADEEEIQGLISAFTICGTLQYVTISSYCTFTPVASYNTLSGTITWDLDNDGCDSDDTLLSYIPIMITNGEQTCYSFGTQNYVFYVPEGTYTLSLMSENNLFETTATVTFPDSNNNNWIENFCLTPNGVHNDVEVVIVPLGAAQPGFDAAYKIIYKNKGNQTLNGDVTFTYDDSILDYVSASPVESSSATGSLSWSYSNLLPFETRGIVVTLNVNGSMETPAVNINDVLPFTATITPVSDDETPADNTFEFNQTVVGSFDPNDITCLEGATVSPEKIGEYLHYNINFENTGTAPATFVVVKDIIDATKYDISTLQILNASHAMEARITDNKVEFIFDNINLAANGGKGNVTFKIKTLNSLTVNSSVTQQADIYFDYNWPIVTNEATTTFAVLSTNNFTKDTSVKLYPNPAKNTVNITAQGNIQTVQLYDVQGRLLQAANASGLTTTVDVTGRAAGIYFVKVTTDKGTAVEKLVKE